MTSLAALILRATVGGLLAGHGAQKLFGSFGGHGIEGTAGMMESIGLRPGHRWAMVAGMSEFVGGVLTTLGALNPLGPIMGLGAMMMATLKVHLGKPIWVTAGGAELPITNIAAMTAVLLAGPGKLSFDSLLGIRIPRWFSFLALVTTIGAVWRAAGSDAADQIARDVEAIAERRRGQVPSAEPEPEGRELRAGAPTEAEPAEAGVESYGSPDEGEPEPLEGGQIAAIRRTQT